VTPRLPLGLIRPLAATIAPPGTAAPAARRRKATLSWRRARRATAPGQPSRYDVHHHWPLTVNLLFRSANEAPASPSPRAATDATPAAFGRAPATDNVMVWGRREAPDAPPQALTPTIAVSQQVPDSQSARPGSFASRARSAPRDDQPVFARVLHSLIEQRWLRTQTTRHLPDQVRDSVGRTAPFDCGPAAIRSVPWRDAAGSVAPGKRSAASPMRPADRTLFTGDPLVRRTLRRIAVIPLVHRATHSASALPGARSTGHVGPPVNVAQSHSNGRLRARATEQVWPDGRTGGAASLAQPFAPIFSSPGAASPGLALAPPPSAAQAAPVTPDVNRLVDEVMRRIERQSRQDRLRRGV
jgi:hypothetical protein